MQAKRLVIIDGYSVLYRAFFATRYLSTAAGQPTNALYGFVSMLFVLLERVQPTAIVVAMDAPGKTFRHAEYAEYKGTRRETAPELKVQLPIARDLIAGLGIPTIEQTGFEADDIIGTISKLAEANGYDTTIVTGDLDALQLVDDCVSVLTMKMGVTDTVTYGPEQVVARYGFGPSFIPDYKAIVGDSSDNIPGVPGIGEKGAASLIQQHGTIESMLEQWDSMDAKFQKKIEPVKDQMLKSKWLATIVRDAPVTYDFKEFKLTPNQLEAAKAMFEELEFRNHLKRADVVLGRYLEGRVKFDEPVEVCDEALEVKESRAGSFESLRDWVGDRSYALYFDQSVAQASMFDEPERTGLVAIGLDVRTAPEADVLRLFEASRGQAILHDAKPVYKKMAASGQAPKFDTMLAGFVLQSGRSQYVLRDLIQGYLDVAPPTTSAQVAASIGLLEGAMTARLIKEDQLKVLTDIEQPLIPILAEMENHGIAASKEYLHDFSKSLQIEIEQAQARVFELAGQEFNIGSPKQLGEVLFEKLMIPGPKKTKTGYATGAEVLQVLAPANPICTEILTWRELSKLKSTYADALPRMVRDDGRIHTTYNQTGAATGRISSNDPNLQNIPIRTELGRKIRHAFVAGEGYQLLSLDYSQIELRVLAHLCGDEALVDAFSRHEDVHRVTAALMYGVEPSDVSRDQRNYSKMLNYAVLYGVTDYGLANQLGGAFSVGEAKALIQQYNERFPKVKGFTDSVIAEARSKGFTTTLLGRRRYFPDIHAANRNERLYAERQAMNAPIQGAAADMMKLAMIDVRKKLGSAKSRMLLTVHDELVFEWVEEDKAIVEEVRQAMEQALPLSVPVEVDAKAGPNWNDMTEISSPGRDSS